MELVLAKPAITSRPFYIEKRLAFVRRFLFLEGCNIYLLRKLKMNKSLVIYNSKYGYTEKYAQWLAEELNADICKNKNLNVDKLKNYFTIIFGGSFYAGRNKGAITLVKYYEQIKDKKVVLFTVGMFDTNSEENIIGINKDLSKVITPEIREKIKIFLITPF